MIRAQGDLVFSSGISFGLHKLTFSYGRSRAHSYGRSRATRNTQAKTLAPTEETIHRYKVNVKTKYPWIRAFQGASVCGGIGLEGLPDKPSTDSPGRGADRASVLR